MYRKAVLAVALSIGLGHFLASSACALSLPLATPKSQGFELAGLARIDRIIRSQIVAGNIPGAIAIVARNGKIVHESIAGYRDIENKKPLTENTIFRFHSMTKPIICAAALVLVDEGKLGLDDPVSKYIPAFSSMRVYVRGDGGDMVTEPLKRPVTVRDLMRHMSGFTYAGFEPYADAGDGPVGKLYDSHNMVVARFPTLADAVSEATKLPLLFQPGTHWHYGMSIDILGYVVEKASGVPLGQFLQTRIFAPLGMTDSSFSVPDAKLDRFTSQYEGTLRGLKLIATPDASAWRSTTRAQSGGGGLVGTAGDYLHFAQMLLNNGELNGVRVLSVQAVHAMSANQLPPGIALSAWTELGTPIGFGLGVAVETDVARRAAAGCNGSYFWSGSERTYFWVDPKLKIVALWMSQAYRYPSEFQPRDSYNKPAATLRNIVYGALVDRKAVAQCRT